jgi:hypothetical protein
VNVGHYIRIGPACARTRQIVRRKMAHIRQYNMGVHLVTVTHHGEMPVITITVPVSQQNGTIHRVTMFCVQLSARRRPLVV